MQIKTVDLTISWSFKFPVLILGFYFFVILPSTRFFFHAHPWFYKNTHILFFAVVVLFAFYRFSSSELGFSPKYLKQHIVLGLISGGLLLLFIHLLDIGLDTTGLTNDKIFEGVDKVNASHNYIFYCKKLSTIFIISMIEQIFFTGLLLKSLLIKINPILAVYATSLIYTLTGFNLKLSSFGLCIGTSMLFKLTGTLYASILFHMGCLIGGELLMNVHPRLKLIFGFLF